MKREGAGSPPVYRTHPGLRALLQEGCTHPALRAPLQGGDCYSWLPLGRGPLSGGVPEGRGGSCPVCGPCFRRALSSPKGDGGPGYFCLLNSSFLPFPVAGFARRQGPGSNDPKSQDRSCLVGIQPSKTARLRVQLRCASPPPLLTQSPSLNCSRLRKKAENKVRPRVKDGIAISGSAQASETAPLRVRLHYTKEANVGRIPNLFPVAGFTRRRGTRLDREQRLCSRVFSRPRLPRPHACAPASP